MLRKLTSYAKAILAHFSLQGDHHTSLFSSMVGVINLVDSQILFIGVAIARLGYVIINDLRSEKIKLQKRLIDNPGSYKEEGSLH